MTIEEANNNLKVIEQIRQHPDYPSSGPETKAKFDAAESKSREFIQQYQAGSHDRNLARAGQEDVAAKKNYGTAEMGELPPPQSFGAMPMVGSAASPAYPPGYNKAVRHQLGATGAATAEMVPGLVPWVEGVGLNLKKRGITDALPQPGDTDAYIGEAPSSLSARGSAMVGTYLAGRGAMGGAAQSATQTAFKPMDAAYQLAKRGVQRILPGSRFMANVAGGATAGLEAGVVNAGVTRAAQAFAPGEKVQPLTVGELAIPTLAGGAFGFLPGVAEWVTNPTSAGGRIAQRYANAGPSGTRAQVLAEERNVPIAGAEPPKPIERASREFENTIEDAAVQGEGRFSQAHADAEKNWMQNNYAPRFHALLSEGRTADPTSTIQKLDDLVYKHASESGQDPSKVELLPLGKKIQELRDQFNSYLGEGATLRDYKNAIDQAASLAQQNRTSKVAEKAYADVEKIIRDDAYAAFQGFRELSEEHKAFQDNHERETKLVYGKDSHEAEDFAGRQSQGRKFLKDATSDSPASTTDSNELALRSEYGQQAVEGMRVAKEVAATKYGEREAIELSKMRGGKAFGTPVAMALARTSPYTVARAGIETGSAIPRIIQPIRSRAAAYGPDADQLRAAIPGMVGMVSTSEEASKELANRAREQAKRLSVTIGEYLNRRNNAAGENQ